MNNKHEIYKGQKKTLYEVSLDQDMNGYSMEYVDFEKVDQDELNEDAKELISKSLTKGGRYGVLVFTDNTVDEDTTVMYALNPKTMDYLSALYSPDDPIVSKEVSEKANELSKSLQNNGVSDMEYYHPVEMGINLPYTIDDSIDSIKDEQEKNNKEKQISQYQQYLAQQGLER